MGTRTRRRLRRLGIVVTDRPQTLRQAPPAEQPDEPGDLEASFASLDLARWRRGA